jgi:hypothetical protein
MYREGKKIEFSKEYYIWIWEQQDERLTKKWINLFELPTWCSIPLFCNICITLNTSTCFEQYYAHPQEVKIDFLQHLVSSLSVSGRALHRLRADCSPLSTGALHGRSQRVTIPNAVEIQFWPPECSCDKETFSSPAFKYEAERLLPASGDV